MIGKRNLLFGLGPLWAAGSAIVRAWCLMPVKPFMVIPARRHSVYEHMFYRHEVPKIAVLFDGGHSVEAIASSLNDTGAVATFPGIWTGSGVVDVLSWARTYEQAHGIARPSPLAAGDPVRLASRRAEHGEPV